MGNFLDDNITKQIKEVFSNLENQVEILVFTSKNDCEFCDDTTELLKEVCELSPKLKYQGVDIDSEGSLVKQYHISRTPAIAVLGQVDGKMMDFGIRFSGIPAGHEFSALIHSIVSVSRQEAGISQETQAYLDSLKSPIHLEIFTTPT
jgi:alkyl hydroperoxide reductase subunit AhpF